MRATSDVIPCPFWCTLTAETHGPPADEFRHSSDCLKVTPDLIVRLTAADYGEPLVCLYDVERDHDTFLNGAEASRLLSAVQYSLGEAHGFYGILGMRAGLREGLVKDGMLDEADR